VHAPIRIPCRSCWLHIHRLGVYALSYMRTCRHNHRGHQEAAPAASYRKQPPHQTSQVKIHRWTHTAAAASEITSGLKLQGFPAWPGPPPPTHKTHAVPAAKETLTATRTHPVTAAGCQYTNAANKWLLLPMVTSQLLQSFAWPGCPPTHASAHCQGAKAVSAHQWAVSPPPPGPQSRVQF
jgi:hypothetical protein